ncbi:MAG TPA: hypothetical protein PLL64_02215 [Rhodothermales bacterium]|nr:hypothetical protein [Bacteroidota bacterium]HRK73061.1 hypothetical protein [Rhodothermales bacterium]HRR08465.1 hypothetical protein [Rhodothermales bacterium]
MSLFLRLFLVVGPWLCLFIAPLHAQTRVRFGSVAPPEVLYPLQKGYVDLETLRLIERDVLLAKDFKSVSPYAARFSRKATSAYGREHILDLADSRRIGTLSFDAKGGFTVRLDSLMEAILIWDGLQLPLGGGNNRMESVVGRIPGHTRVLFTAFYRQHDAHAYLMAHDLLVGGLIWTKKMPTKAVLQNVTLSLFQNRLVVEHEASAQRSVFILDTMTGNTLFQD